MMERRILPQAHAATARRRGRLAAALLMALSLGGCQKKTSASAAPAALPSPSPTRTGANPVDAAASAPDAGATGPDARGGESAEAGAADPESAAGGGRAPEEIPCADPRPLAAVCRCLRDYVEGWGDGVKGTCETERRIAEVQILRVKTTDRHAGIQYFIVHEGPGGASVLKLLEHHTPGGGGVYRDFSIKEARARALGPGRVLWIDTIVVETEISFSSRGDPTSKRELSRSEGVTVCALTTPARRAPFCLERFPVRERGIDEATGRTWERVHDLRLDEDGAVSHLPVSGAGADRATRHKLW